MTVLWDVLAVLVGYLIGSIPFSHLVTRWRTGRDVRQVGVGNAGARNVWHVAGHGWGVLVFVLDGLKGAAAVLLARALGASVTGALLAGPAAILGHDFPLFTGFRGGKGLSTTVGVLLVWTPWPALIGLALFGALQLVLRNADRSIPFGAAASILLTPLFGYPWTMCLYALALFSMLWLRKLQDRSHQQRVWDASGWRDVERSDWYGDAAEGKEGR